MGRILRSHQAVGTTDSPTFIGLTLSGAFNWTGGRVWYVPIGASIATAIAAATAGDVLLLGAGTYTVTAALEVNKQLAIIGQGAGMTTIVCATNGIHAIHVTASNCYIGHLSIAMTTNSGSGDATRIDGTAGTVLTGVIVEYIDVVLACAGAIASGIRGVDASVVVRGCRVTGATGTGGGIYFVAAATAEVDLAVRVYDCFADITASVGTSEGIGIFDTGSAKLIVAEALHCRFKMVRAAAVTTYGAAGSGDGVTLTLRHCVLEADPVGSYDAAQLTSSVVNLDNCTLVNGTTTGTVARINTQALNNAQIAGALDHDGTTVGFYGTTPVVKGAGLTAPLTTVTCSAPGTPDYAIADLVANGYGFVAKDEGQSVLKVIANLQARVNELEARLSSAAGVGVFT